MLRKYVEHNLRSSDHCPLKIRLIGCDQSDRVPPKSGLPRSVILFGIVLSGNPLAGLVADRAACLARGLAGASAFAAARHFFCRRAGDRLDLIHNASPYVAFFIIIIYRAQNCKRFWQKMRRRRRAGRKSRALLHWQSKERAAAPVCIGEGKERATAPVYIGEGKERGRRALINLKKQICPPSRARACVMRSAKSGFKSRFLRHFYFPQTKIEPFLNLPSPYFPRTRVHRAPLKKPARAPSKKSRTFPHPKEISPAMTAKRK